MCSRSLFLQNDWKSRLVWSVYFKCLLTTTQSLFTIQTAHQITEEERPQEDWGCKWRNESKIPDVSLSCFGVTRALSSSRSRNIDVALVGAPSGPRRCSSDLILETDFRSSGGMWLSTLTQMYSGAHLTYLFSSWEFPFQPAYVWSINSRDGKQTNVFFADEVYLRRRTNSIYYWSFPLMFWKYSVQVNALLQRIIFDRKYPQ